jgi:hypothetical protein
VYLIPSFCLNRFYNPNEHRPCSPHKFYSCCCDYALILFTYSTNFAEITR